jgi:hypothetical protein
MTRPKTPTWQLPRPRTSLIVLEEINSVTHALACLAGLHTWSTLDPEIHGVARGCMWCGEVKVLSSAPLTSIVRQEEPRTRLSA